MRCRVCAEPAGWWRRVCADCRRLRDVLATHRGAGAGAVMEGLLATGVHRAKLERFLDANLDGSGSVRDQMAAEMTNQLLAALGHRHRQTAEDVRRIRERGNWKQLDRRPAEPL